MQGVTEVVPVSSSAHLTLLPWLLGWPPAADRTTFAAGLHAGSCLGIALALGRPNRRPSTPVAALALATSAPAALVGLLAADLVERRLGRPHQLAALLALAGGALAVADTRPQERAVGGREAAWAALAQVAALAPGVSRSGAALTALRAAGVRRQDAEAFSLLMSLPVTAGAAGLQLAMADRATLRALRLPLAVGVPASALAAHLATGVRTRRAAHGLLSFALYRVSLAMIIAVTAYARRSRPDEEPR